MPNDPRAALVALLKADAPLAALIAGRVYPFPGPKDAPRPFVCHHLVGDDPERTRDGSKPTQSAARFQLDSFAADSPTAARVAAAVANVLDGHDAGPVLFYVAREDEVDTAELERDGTDRAAGRVTQTYRVRYNL
jgi:hypothetical protein